MAGNYATPLDLRERAGGLHQHRAGRRLPRRRPAGGDLPDRARRRQGGARARASTRSRSAGSNFVKPDQFPYQTPVAVLYDTGDYDATHGQARGDLRPRRLPRPPARRARRGASCAASASPPTSRPAASRRRSLVGSLGARAGLYESATVRVNPTGGIIGLHRHRTATARATRPPSPRSSSDLLGIDAGQIDIVHGDTARVPFGMGTYGSRSLAVGGSAIVKATEKIIAKAKKIAAHLMEASEADIEFKDGKLHRRRHRQVGRLDRRDARRLRAAQVPDRGARAGARGDRLLRPGELHLPGRRLRLRGRGRPRDRRGRRCWASPPPTTSATSSTR